jgi:hypothetical protein
MKSRIIFLANLTEMQMCFLRTEKFNITMIINILEMNNLRVQKNLIQTKNFTTHLANITIDVG